MPYIDEESRFPILFNLADEALNKDKFDDGYYYSPSDSNEHI